MYIHNMSKNVMLSDEAYEKLRRIKGKDDSISFSDAVLSMEPKKKTVGDLIKVIEKIKIPKDDKEYDIVMKDLKKGWARWTKKHA